MQLQIFIVLNGRMFAVFYTRILPAFGCLMGRLSTGFFKRPGMVRKARRRGYSTFWCKGRWQDLFTRADTIFSRDEANFNPARC
jgi:hypothetical protein